MPRPHALADPDFAVLVAEHFVAGHSREKMCEALGVGDVKTITRWRKDPRVQVHVRKLLQEQTAEICRRTDAIIFGRLAACADTMTIKELLEIRKEFMGSKLREQTEGVDESTINEAQAFFDNNPDAAQQLRALLAGGSMPAADPAE